MQPALSVAIVSVLFGTAWGDCEDVPPYSAKCRTIYPLQEVDESRFDGLWWLWASGDTTPFVCTNFHSTRTGPHSYHNIAKSTHRNGTAFKMEFDGRVRKCERKPKGYIFEATPDYYPERQFEYMLDMDEKGAVITYSCVAQGSGVHEQVHVYTREKDYDPVRVAKVLKKNNLSDFPVTKTYHNCPRIVEEL